MASDLKTFDRPRAEAIARLLIDALAEEVNKPDGPAHAIAGIAITVATIYATMVGAQRTAMARSQVRVALGTLAHTTFMEFERITE